MAIIVDPICVSANTINESPQRITDLHADQSDYWEMIDGKSNRDLNSVLCLSNIGWPVANHNNDRHTIWNERFYSYLVTEYEFIILFI